MNNLIEKTKEIFKKEKLDVLIGFERGTTPLTASPCFIESIESIDKLIFDSTSQQSLAKYVLEEMKRNPEKKVGFIAKGCDARAAIELVAEEQIEREKLIIIGVPCNGVFDPVRIRGILNGEEITDYELREDKVRIVAQDFDKEVNKSELISEFCFICQYPNAPQYDYFIGEPVDIKTNKEKLERQKEFEKKSFEKRWEYFRKEFDKCIRCYACRNVCPVCYCNQCYVDKNNPCWIGKGAELSDNALFHILRILHVAGRCTSCGACVRVCPVGVDLTLLTSKMQDEIKERFNFVPGLDFESKPALEDYSENDDDEFIK